MSRIKKLLMIDDNTIDQMVYKRIVDRSQLVNDLVQFTDARAALDYLVEHKDAMPDLILLDINMPGMNGFDFLEAAAEEFGSIMSPVVVMLTTSLNPSDRKRASEFTCISNFLNKPLTVELLNSIAQSRVETPALTWR